MTGKQPSGEGDDHPALEQPTRRRIYRQIGRQPGINWNQLQRSLEISTGVLMHHISRLEEEELIVRLGGDDEREILHFHTDDASLAADERTRMLFGSGATRRVALLILETPGITPEQLSDAIGIGVPGIEYHLRKLVGHGLIDERSDGGEQVYEPTKRLEAWGEEVGWAFDTTSR